MPNAVELSNVTKRYGANVLVDGISASMAEGEVIGLLGHNGAGKTTLIRLALGLIRPSKGEVRVLGHVPTGADARTLRARIGYLPENVAFYRNFTGQEVMTYLARLKHVPGAAVPALLERVGLGEAGGKPVRAYSKGMRQRLGLAQALLGDPELLFLDEPTTGLDPLATRQFFELLNDLRSKGRTVVISSHLLAELEPHLDSALILRQGRIVAGGTVAEMHEAAGLADTITARFRGGGQTIAQEAWLAKLGVTHRGGPGGGLDIEVPPARKLEVMRRLVESEALCDITVREPTLARLYAALGTEEKGRVA
jgi:Cu-processing system ATP-binding protein